MSRVVLFLALLLSAAGASAIDVETIEDPVLRARYESITEELRCLVCQNQTIADSNAELAIDLRQQVRKMLEEGASDAAIRDYMVSRYGDFVLYKPRLAPQTMGLWFGPLVLLIIAVTVLARVVASSRAAQAEAAASGAADPD